MRQIAKYFAQYSEPGKSTSSPRFSGDIARICKLLILNTLGIPVYAYSKWSNQLVENFDVYLHAKNNHSLLLEILHFKESWNLIGKVDTNCFVQSTYKAIYSRVLVMQPNLLPSTTGKDQNVSTNWLRQCLSIRSQMISLTFWIDTNQRAALNMPETEANGGNWSVKGAWKRWLIWCPRLWNTIVTYFWKN